MPKLIRKTKISAAAVTADMPIPDTTTTKTTTYTDADADADTNNNNNNNDETLIQTYERLNPRYANTDAADADAATETLHDKIQNRISSYIEEPWMIIGSYFEGKHLDQLVRHQIESYNDMVNVQLKRTVDMFNPVKIASDQDYDRVSHKYRLEVEVTF